VNIFSATCSPYSTTSSVWVARSPSRATVIVPEPPGSFLRTAPPTPRSGDVFSRHGQQQNRAVRPCTPAASGFFLTCCPCSRPILNPVHDTWYYVGPARTLSEETQAASRSGQGHLAVRIFFYSRHGAGSCLLGLPGSPGPGQGRREPSGWRSAVVRHLRPAADPACGRAPLVGRHLRRRPVPSARGLHKPHQAGWVAVSPQAGTAAKLAARAKPKLRPSHEHRVPAKTP